MKKLKWIISSITFLSVFIIVIFIVLSNISESKYPRGGRDTVKEFGDARFVILVGYNSDNSKFWTLYDRSDYGKSLDEDVYVYEDKKPFAYVIGSEGYTLINYKTGDIIQSNNLSDFNDENINIFTKLKEKEKN